MILMSVEEILTYLLVGMLIALKFSWEISIRDDIISWSVKTILWIALVGRLGTRKTWNVLWLFTGLIGVYQLIMLFINFLD